MSLSTCLGLLEAFRASFKEHAAIASQHLPHIALTVTYSQKPIQTVSSSAIPSPTPATSSPLSVSPPTSLSPVYAIFTFALFTVFLGTLISSLSITSRRRSRSVGTLITVVAIVFGYQIRSYATFTEVVAVLHNLCQSALSALGEYVEFYGSFWTHAIQSPYLSWLPKMVQYIDTATRIYGIYLQFIIILTYIIHGKSSTITPMTRTRRVVKFSVAVQADSTVVPLQDASKVASETVCSHAEYVQNPTEPTPLDFRTTNVSITTTDKNVLSESTGTVRPVHINNGHANAAQGVEENLIVEFPPMPPRGIPPTPQLLPQDVPIAPVYTSPDSMEDVAMASPSPDTLSPLPSTSLPVHDPPTAVHDGQPIVECSSSRRASQQRPQRSHINSAVPSLLPELPVPNRQPAQRRAVNQPNMIKRSASTREDPVNIYVDYQSNARNQGEGPSRIPGNIPVNPYQEAASKLGLNYNYEKSKFAPMAPPGLTKNPNGIRRPPFVFQPHRPAPQRIFEANNDKGKGVARDLTSSCEHEAAEEPKILDLTPPIHVQRSLAVFGPQKQQSFQFNFTALPSADKQSQLSPKAGSIHNPVGDSDTDDSGFDELNLEYSEEQSSRSFCFAGAPDFNAGGDGNCVSPQPDLGILQDSKVNLNFGTLDVRNPLPQKEFTLHIAPLVQIEQQQQRVIKPLPRKGSWGDVFEAIPDNLPKGGNPKHQAVTVLDRSDNTDVFKVDLTKFRGKFRASACAVKCFKSQSFSGESECKVYQDLMKRNQLEGRIHRIPEFYTSQKIEKVFKFAMQLLDSDLFVVMRQLGDKKLVIHPDDLKSMTYQLVDAVKFMHDSGYVHCDIKPENIAMECASFETTSDPSGQNYAKFVSPKVYLFDFNSSCHQEHMKDIGPLGTVLYQSPEVLFNHTSSTPRDAWALGLALYELCYIHAAFAPDYFMGGVGGPEHKKFIDVTLGPIPPHILSDPNQLEQTNLSDKSNAWAEHFQDTLRTETIFNQFLLKLLLVDPEERMSMEEALEDPYICDLAQKRIPSF